MAQLNRPLGFLTPDDMEKVHQAAVQILERTGIIMAHHQALDYLADAGAKVDRDTMRVHFPSELVQRCVKKMRKAYADPERLPASMAVRYSHVRFQTEPAHIYPDFSVSAGGFCCFIHDLNGQRRPADMNDVRDMLRLADQLDGVTFTGLPVSDQTTDQALRPVVMAAELVKHTKKLGGIEVYDALDVEYVSRIAEVVAGGAEALRQKPVLVGYAEARSPLCFDANMVDVFIAYIKRGLPQTLDTMPCAGTTAPATLAGTLAVGCAETLAAMVLAYAVDENAVVGVDLNCSHADMRSGLFAYGGFGRVPYILGRIAMISHYYGCPAGVHGLKTNACTPGFEAGAEKMLSMVMPILAGACGIGTMGALENAMTCSPVQMVLDDALIGGMRYVLKDFDFSDQAFALDLIDQLAPGGEFLTSEHTAEHYGDNMYHDWLFECKPWASAANAATAAHRAAQRAKELMAVEHASPLTDEQIGQIDAIVAEATAARKQQASQGTSC